MDARDLIREQVLILRCQSGDMEAFEPLFERYTPPLKYYLRRMLNAPEKAEDVLQTVWLKAIRGLRSLQNPRAFRTWLYRIARNEALLHMRNDKRWPAEDNAALEDLPDDHAEVPLDAFDTAAVHLALERLSPAHREVLTLKFLEDMSYEEIAEVLGCRLGTVRSRIHYAKRAMRPLLEESYDD